ncbi:MAG: TadE family protein [Pseudomonadota bacterium]
MNVRRKLSKLWSSEDGTVTIEFVMWLPIFMSILGIVTDASLLLTKHSQLLDAARDASRFVATGRMTEVEAEAYLTDRLGTFANYAPDVQVDAMHVTTNIVAPYADFVIFGDMLVLDSNMTASISMALETAVVATGET